MPSSNQNLEDQDSAWHHYANHREIITRLTLSAASARGSNGDRSDCDPGLAGSRPSLAILGAGQCYDIDLKKLLAAFATILLADIDENAVREGLTRQNVSDNLSAITIDCLDVSGVHSKLNQYASAPSPELLESIIEATTPKIWDREFDVVTSTCLLSQLLCRASEIVGEASPKFVELLQAIRRSHIEVMVNAIRSGGGGVLVTDFVSSISLPELLTTKDLNGTIRRAIDDNNYLHGLNPVNVGNAFSDPHIAPHICELRISDPWRWVAADRIYACIAVTFRRALDESSPGGPVRHE